MGLVCLKNEINVLKDMLETRLKDYRRHSKVDHVEKGVEHVENPPTTTTLVPIVRNQGGAIGLPIGLSIASTTSISININRIIGSNREQFVMK